MAGVNDPGQMGPPELPPSWPPATPPAGPPPMPPNVPSAAASPPPPGWTPPAAPAGGTSPKGGGSKMLLGVGAVVVALLIVGAAVILLTRSSKPTVAANVPGTSATPSVAPTVAPTATPTESTPTPDTSAGVVGGFGETAANPDTTFICAASASTGSTVIAYVTAAGSDSDTANALCTALEADGTWADISTIAASSYEAVPTCWLSTPGGSVTARIYTAVPGGSDSATQTLCSTVFESLGVTASPGPSPTPAS